MIFILILKPNNCQGLIMKYLPLLLFSCFLFELSGQIVSNVKFKQEGDQIIINYNLQTEEPIGIRLYYSVDGGGSFNGPLKNVSGDVGSGIPSGLNKKLTWDVLSSIDYLYDDNVIFKVVADIQFIEMVYIEGGTFMMGSNTGDKDETPTHEVQLNDFYIGKFEVTQNLWIKIMYNNPSYFKICDNCPVERISSNDIKTFLIKLNQKTGEVYRLPTEAEWEYAASGGKDGKNTIYSGSHNVTMVSWCDNNAGLGGLVTHIVGTLLPNELGIYDMSGNVSEICSDFYDPNYYLNSPIDNPKGPKSGLYVVSRGGGAYSPKNKCTVTKRKKISLYRKNKYIGFRLAKDIQ